jgi:hypothetical protein
MNALTPSINLTGNQPSGTTVKTSLSSSDASFVNGVFSEAATTVTKAEVSPPMQTLVVASGQTFVLPGTHILIFPIGAIITGTWALLLIVTIGYGTFGRMQFRDQYRRRSQRALKRNVATI